MTESDFEELCESAYERVAKAAYLILGNRQDALDIAQETFARALERWPQVRSMEIRSVGSIGSPSISASHHEGRVVEQAHLPVAASSSSRTRAIRSW